VLGLAAAVLTGCRDASPRLEFSSPVGGGGVGLPHVRAGEQWSIGMESTICLSRPGAVTITNVSPVKGTGVRVVDFAVRPNQVWRPTPSRVEGDFLGTRHQSLAWLGFTATRVDVACSKNPARGYELAIRVAKTTVQTAHSSGWLVSYAGGGHSGTFTMPFTLTLAPGRLRGA
jgi:hypothetical protein